MGGFYDETISLLRMMLHLSKGTNPVFFRVYYTNHVEIGSMKNPSIVNLVKV